MVNKKKNVPLLYGTTRYHILVISVVLLPFSFPLSLSSSSTEKERRERERERDRERYKLCIGIRRGR